MSTITSKSEKKRNRSAIIEEYQQEKEQDECLMAMMLPGIIDSRFFARFK
jgi:hypothetical protein